MDAFAIQTTVVKQWQYGASQCHRDIDNMHSCQHTHILCLSCQDLCRSFCRQTCIPFLASPEDSMLVLVLTVCHSSFQCQTCSQTLIGTIIKIIKLSCQKNKKNQLTICENDQCTFCHWTNDCKALSVHELHQYLFNVYIASYHEHPFWLWHCWLATKKTSGPQKVLLQWFYPAVIL